MKTFAPVVEVIGNTVESTVDTIMQTAGCIADEREKLDEMRKAIIKRMEAGEDPTSEQKRTFGIESNIVSNNYQIKYDPFYSLGKTLKRYFWLEYISYVYKGKTYFQPHNIKVSLPSVPSSSSYQSIYQEHADLTNVYIDKIKKIGEKRILGIELPTEVYILLKYSAHKDYFKIKEKNGKALLRLSDAEKPDIIFSSGDFSLKYCELNRKYNIEFFD